jgi:type 1 glutamine amidotransferase
MRTCYLERYINAGGSFVGIHPAADTDYDWPWCEHLVGTRFENHPKIQSAEAVVEDPLHLSTHMLPSRWQRKDEWYNFRENFWDHVHVLLTLDVSSYEGSNQTGDHPIAWCHEFDGGRSWYTGGGHTNDSYAEPLFRSHILGGIFWAMGDSNVAD